MANRLPISGEAAQKLVESHQKPPMSPDEKVRQREERSNWADTGCLPVEQVTFEDIIAKLTAEDIPAVETEVQRKTTSLLVKVSTGTVDPQELNTFFSRVYTLHARKLISDQVFGEAQALFAQMTPPVKAHVEG